MVEQSRIEDEYPTLVPRFRVVKVGNSRRGIRLEEVFWSGLKDIAAAENVSIGDIIQQCEERLGGSGNLTSAIRVEVASRLRDGLAKAKKRTDLTELHKMITACPTPCFTLSDDKRIIAYNIHFLNFIQSRLSQLPAKVATKGVSLTLDLQFDDLVSRLKIPGSGPATLGFVITFDKQSLRGRLNAVIAPLVDRDAILGYVLPN